MKKIAAVFRDGTNYKVFLLSVFIIGLGYGIHKGLLDNYLAEIVGIGEQPADDHAAGGHRRHSRRRRAFFAIVLFSH